MSGGARIDAPAETRRHRGAVAHRAGQVAEDQVREAYLRSGHVLAKSRWRGKGGEIDLVMRKGNELVFVEVKRAPTLHEAAFRLSARQFRRICACATEFLAGEPLGFGTPVRFDLALVGGNGEIEIVENLMAA